MFIRNIHRNMRMNQFRGNLRCETEEHTELLQTKEEGTNQNSKTASNTRLKGKLSWKLPVLKRCQKKYIETATKMEPVH